LGSSLLRKQLAAWEVELYPKTPPAGSQTTKSTKAIRVTQHAGPIGFRVFRGFRGGNFAAYAGCGIFIIAGGPNASIMRMQCQALHADALVISGVNLSLLIGLKERIH